MERTLNVLRIGLKGVFKNTSKPEDLTKNWKVYVKSLNNTYLHTGPLELEELKALKYGMIQAVEEGIDPEDLLAVANIEGFTPTMIMESKEELKRYIDNNCN